MRYEIWQSKQNGQWYWHLLAPNHKIIAQGEGYHNKADCLHAIDLVKMSYSAPVYER